MKVLQKIVFALACAAALGSAQTETTSPSVAKEAPATLSPANPPPAAVAPTPQAATPVAGVSDQLLPARKPATEEKTPAASPAGAKAPYVIGPLDVISVKVWNNPNLSSALDVGPDGMISLPLIGQVKADGLTAMQLREALAKRLGEFLNSPEVDVQVLKVL